jgi:hypothetical protein
MGSNNRFHISCNVTDNVTAHSLIVGYANDHEQFCKDKDFESWAWNKWSILSKWNADEIVSYLSKKFPNIIFRVACSGDYNYVQFWMNGACVDERDVFKHPTFPSNDLFVSTYKRVVKERAKAKEAQELKSKLAQIEAAKKRIEELSKEKERLSKGSFY